MPEFQSRATIRSDIDEFTKGYVECALWLMTDDKGDDMDDFEGEIADSAWTTIIADCTSFQLTNRALLDEAIDDFHRPESHLGHDFWLTRNGHGTGFWDRGSEDVWEKLEEASKLYSESDIYVGDDGKAYVSPEISGPKNRIVQKGD
jgi:hypothetical protein